RAGRGVDSGEPIGHIGVVGGLFDAGWYVVRLVGWYVMGPVGWYAMGWRSTRRDATALPGPGNQPAQLRPGAQVVGFLAVAAGDVVPMRGGYRRLQLEGARGTGLGVIESGKGEHALQMGPVGGADLVELLVAEIAFVRQADARLLRKHQVAFR